MTDPFFTRRGEATDTPLLQRLERAAFGEKSWGDQGIAEGFGAPGVEILLGGRIGDKATGFAIWRVLPGEAELLSIGVSPASRRSGLGGALLDAVILAAQNAKASVIHLEVDPDNRAAVSLYGRAGFVASGRRKAYYRTGADALLMCKRLLDNAF